MTRRTEPARGMRDFLPDDVRRRQHVMGVVSRVYERYGFEPIETPAVENLETLLGKYGDEGNQLIFKILKRGEHEATGEADLALRYDLTVPLARVVAHHQAKLPKFFKRYQIQPVWRADRPARGRFREFYQCDVDAMGSTSPMVEAEICGAASDVLIELGFDDFYIRLNHRALLTAVLAAAGIPEALHGTALIALDKLDKVGMPGVASELAERGVSQAGIDGLGRVVEGSLAADAGVGGPAAALDFVEQFLATGQDDESPSPPDFGAPLSNLRDIIRLSAATRAGGRIRFDPCLARGLSYYTGAIMEIVVPDLRGSLGGGGRYDNLVGMFLGQPVPACGFSLGLERILVVMAEREMFPPSLQLTPADVMVTVFSAEDAPQVLALAARLRGDGLRVLVYPEADKLGKQIKYADARGIPCVAMLGADEMAAGTVTVKHLAAQTQATYPQSAAGAAIREALTHRG
ncbi:MAG TPA: histidine--tRNA ligase [Vicinamibacterales bacterium]